jgi:hypothetical protein
LELTSANTISAVDKNEWNDGHIVRWLDRIVVIFEILKEWVVGRVEEGS